MLSTPPKGGVCPLSDKDPMTTFPQPPKANSNRQKELARIMRRVRKTALLVLESIAARYEPPQRTRAPRRRSRNPSASARCLTPAPDHSSTIR
jgi:hypothetical protein